MVCIYCGSSTKVANSRLQKRVNQIWRRRQCLQCHNTFTTHETTELGSSIVVQRGSIEIEPFSRDTLFVSIYESCKHRPEAVSNASALTQTTIGLLRGRITGSVLERDIIASVTAGVLDRFDPTAGAVYRAYHHPIPQGKAQKGC